VGGETVSEPDPLLHELRAKISDTDRTILRAVNARLELVAQIKTWKESHGIGFLDPEREQAMLQELTEANSGPLSEQGVRELLTAILDLTKREVS
jgi:3-deoxy-7-phosphoheptulonate synthase / chorismate mutase